ncbi:unnamed protein product [Amoebophrya sp. A120]|nr:unnamed protein product [Amoebophrya sp. A120]|eukprot:GSA120T00010536001.1
MGGQGSKVTVPQHDQELVATEIATKLANENLPARDVQETAEQEINQAAKDDAITRNLSSSQREMEQTIKAKLQDDPAFKQVMESIKDGKATELHARYWSAPDYPFPINHLIFANTEIPELNSEPEGPGPKIELVKGDGDFKDTATENTISRPADYFERGGKVTFDVVKGEGEQNELEMEFQAYVDTMPHVEISKQGSVATSASSSTLQQQQIGDKTSTHDVPNTDPAERETVTTEDANQPTTPSIKKNPSFRGTARLQKEQEEKQQAKALVEQQEAKAASSATATSATSASAIQLEDQSADKKMKNKNAAFQSHSYTRTFTFEKPAATNAFFFQDEQTAFKFKTDAANLKSILHNQNVQVFGVISIFGLIVLRCIYNRSKNHENVHDKMKPSSSRQFDENLGPKLAARMKTGNTTSTSSSFASLHSKKSSAKKMTGSKFVEMYGAVSPSFDRMRSAHGDAIGMSFESEMEPDEEVD